MVAQMRDERMNIIKTHWIESPQNISLLTKALHAARSYTNPFALSLLTHPINLFSSVFHAIYYLTINSANLLTTFASSILTWEYHLNRNSSKHLHLYPGFFFHTIQIPCYLTAYLINLIPQEHHKIHSQNSKSRFIILLPRQYLTHSYRVTLALTFPHITLSHHPELNLLLNTFIAPSTFLSCARTFSTSFLHSTFLSISRPKYIYKFTNFQSPSSYSCLPFQQLLIDFWQHSDPTYAVNTPPPQNHPPLYSIS